MFTLIESLKLLVNCAAAALNAVCTLVICAAVKPAVPIAASLQFGLIVIAKADRPTDTCGSPDTLKDQQVGRAKVAEPREPNPHGSASGYRPLTQIGLAQAIFLSAWITRT